MKAFSFFIFLTILATVLACFGGKKNDKKGGKKDKKSDEIDDNKDNPKSSELGGAEADHWPDAPGLTKADITAWLNQMKKDTPGDKDKVTVGDLPPGHPWSYDLGAAHMGQLPPPWSKIKQDPGRPVSCYLKPMRGSINCTAYVYRYAFNPYKNDCDRFVFNGCGGNSNNYYTLERCRSACNGPTVACVLCDEDLDTIRESLDMTDIKNFDGEVSDSYESDQLDNFDFTSPDGEDDRDTDEK